MHIVQSRHTRADAAHDGVAALLGEFRSAARPAEVAHRRSAHRRTLAALLAEPGDLADGPDESEPIGA